MSLRGNGDICRQVYESMFIWKIVINIVEIVLFYALETKAINKK